MRQLISTGLMLVLSLFCLAASSVTATETRYRGLGVYSGLASVAQGDGNVLIGYFEAENGLAIPGPVLGGFYRMILSPDFSVQFSSQYSFSMYQGNSALSDSMADVNMQTHTLPVDISGVICVLPEGNYRPYFLLGAGLMYWRTGGSGTTSISEMNPLFKLGTGIQITLKPTMNLNIGLNYIHPFTDQDIFPAPPYNNIQQANGLISLTCAVEWHNLVKKDDDTDRDGIMNADDACPTQPEDFDQFQDMDGCPDPDNDQDGLADQDDQCPIQAEDIDGFEDADGCPELDNDQDGLADTKDKCPNDPEDLDRFEDQDGCPDPDNDQDGVLDQQDRCPQTPPGVQVDATGCPPEPTATDKDSDGDGLLDKQDLCPQRPEDLDGFEDQDGCPDLDNDQDGILDLDDRCPREPEDMDECEDADGCPDTDNDGDGILDVDDKCPGTSGTLDRTKETYNGYNDDDGCPDEKPQEIKKGAKLVLKGINFQTGSAALTQSSYAVLDQVFESLNAYPEVRVFIKGHTDNVGNPQSNLDLSRRRAMTVMQYLINQGIEASRLMAQGYGATEPIASNNTDKGRAENRRIEFERIE